VVTGCVPALPNHQHQLNLPCKSRVFSPTTGSDDKRRRLSIPTEKPNLSGNWTPTPRSGKLPICRDFMIGETGFEPATARPPAGGMGWYSVVGARVCCVFCRWVLLSFAQFVPRIVPQRRDTVRAEPAAAKTPIETRLRATATRTRGDLLQVGEELRGDLDVLDLADDGAHSQLVLLQEIAEPLSVD
jgi:hypothetical protein